ncbi:hypothetical protein EGW08_015005, partial [Elysia chlorotica]
LHSDAGRVLAIAALVELDHLSALVSRGGVQGVELAHVGPQLLHRARAESVAGRDQHAEPVLHQPEANLATENHRGDVRRLPDAVDPTEGDHVRPLVLARVHSVSQNVHPAARGQDLYTGVGQGGLHSGRDAWSG